MIGAVLNFIKGGFLNRLKIYIVIAILSVLGGCFVYIKILRLERDTAVSTSTVAKTALEASQQARKKEIEALEQARKDDEGRYKFSVSVKKEVSMVKDNRPLSHNQRIIADRVRERYTNKYRD